MCACFINLFVPWVLVSGLFGSVGMSVSFGFSFADCYTHEAGLWPIEIERFKCARKTYIYREAANRYCCFPTDRMHLGAHSLTKPAEKLIY